MELQAPFPYFGGKKLAAETVWLSFGSIKNYVEPFAGSAAMLLSAPEGKRIETINDFDGFVSNFWRAISKDAAGVAAAANWPVNEIDLFSRHGHLVRQYGDLYSKLCADPDYFDVKFAGWWCWGLCNWIGSGWCSGNGPWVLSNDGEYVNKNTLGNAGRGINRQLPHLGNAGQGINRKLPHLGNAGQGINRQTKLSREDFIHEWFLALQNRLRDVRVTCGDWGRVVKDSVTTRHGLTGVFLDPPYTKGEMDYAVGGVGTELPVLVRKWCIENGNNKKLRIVLCGHAGEHDELLDHGWFIKNWKARKGYAITDEAVQNAKDETIWCSPNCVKSGREDVNAFSLDVL